MDNGTFVNTTTTAIRLSYYDSDQKVRNLTLTNVASDVPTDMDLLLGAFEEAHMIGADGVDWYYNGRRIDEINTVTRTVAVRGIR